MRYFRRPHIRQRHARPLLGHEPLENRVCLSADTAVDPVLMSWHGTPVEARRDAWIVRSDANWRATNLGAGWQTAHLGEGFFSLVAPGAGEKDVLDWAARAAGVAYVEPDFIHRHQRLSNDPDLGQLWGLNNTGQSGGVVDADIDAPEAWDVTTGSRSVVVAVIDSGVDYNHSDLAANMWRNPREVPGDGIDNDGNGFVDDVYGYDFGNNDADPMDDDGHGTHVAGTIGAVGNNSSGVVGVNWRVSMMALKMFGGPNGGSTSAAISSINYVTNMRRAGVNVVASNNSWGGGGPSTALRDAIEAGGRAGVLFVAAAGNNGSNNDVSPFYPASYDSDFLIAVASTDRFNQLSGFSNFGATSVDIGAPGSSIYSTLPGNRYGIESGTSMAAPHVTGAIALLAAAQPAMTAAELRSTMLGTASPLSSLAGRTVTGGLLNANDAVRLGADALVADIIDVSPDPRTTAVSSIQIAFNRAVTGFDMGDLRLVRSGSTVSLSGASLASTDGGRTFRLSGLTSATTAAGTYRLTLNAAGSGIVDSSGVSLSASASDSWTTRAALTDPGDTIGRARAVTLRNNTARLSGRIGDGSWGSRDVDFYAVRLTAGQALVIDIDAGSLPGGSTLDSYLRLFNRSGRQVASNDDSNGVDSYLSYVAPSSGTYYVGVSGFGNAAYDPGRAGSGRSGSTGDYQVAFRVLSRLTADIIDVSPDPRTTAVSSIQIAFNRSVTGFDMRDLRLVRGGSTVSLSGASLASTDGGRTFRLSGLTSATTAAGTYRLTLNATGSGIVDSWGVSLSASASDSWTTRAALPDPGDTIGSARAVTLRNNTARLSGRIGDGSWGSRDVDFYAVRLTAGQRLVIDIDARSLPGGSTLDSYLRLFNRSRRQVASNDDSNGLDSYISYVAPASGTYYVGVSGFGNSAYDPGRAGSGRSGSTGDYQVAFRVTASSRSLEMGMTADQFAALAASVAGEREWDMVRKH